MQFDPTRRNPQTGDALTIRLLKPFQTGDAYQFRAIAGPLLNVRTSYLPGEFVLYQNYPNPFNPITTIKYQIPAQSHVILKVFDILGREVATLVDEVQGSGFKSVTFDASRVASGVYLYRLQAGTYISARKMVVMK